MPTSSPRQGPPLACGAVRSWLATHHRTHEWLGVQLGVGVNTVSRWLSGRRLPLRKYREQIAKLSENVISDRMWFLPSATVCQVETTAEAASL